ncbi:MAG TPA: Na/Pi symporter [Cyclobacteriaceae bacterium]|nr:Na/Pi symporter [Cyclobacteriaceae bacterium]
MEEPVLSPTPTHTRWKIIFRNTAYILVALLIFLFALELMLSSLQHLGKIAAETIILATSNPFTALFIGLLITAIIQSSTATTSMTVALVASGSLTLESAVPIIMGANIGTTITSTIVSLGFLPKKKEFRRAVASGTYHDFFNILTAFILFPLEYYFQFLSRLSASLANTFFHQPVGSGPVNISLLGGFGMVTDWLAATIGNGFVLIILSLTLLFGSILFFRKVLTNTLGFGSPDRFQRFFFRSPLKSFAWGVLTTAAIRSSSVTTSLVVPLVAKRIITLRSAVPFILGANIGTTLSAFIAAMLNSNTAISIAIAHFLFNFIGILIFFPVPALREIPIRLAKGLGRITMKYRLAGLVYLLTMFFFIPFSLIFLNRDAVKVTELTYRRVNQGTTSLYTIIAKTFDKSTTSQWVMNPEENNTEPSQIYSVYRRNNLLIINNELFELNKPGFCRDGEDHEGKFEMCIREILPHLLMSPELSVTEVYIFEKKYEANPSRNTLFYISAPGNLLVKKEQFDGLGNVLMREELIKAEVK